MVGWLVGWFSSCSYSVSSSLSLSLHLERVRFPQPNLLKLCSSYYSGDQTIVHTLAELQDKCTETLQYFLVSTFLVIVWQSCSVTSHCYRPFKDCLQWFWQYPLL